MFSLKRITSLGLICTGLMLIVLSIIGDVTNLGDYKSAPPRSFERFNGELVKTVDSINELYNEAQSRAEHKLKEYAPKQAMKVLFETTTDYFTHNDQEYYTPYSNWIMWSFGLVDRSLSKIKAPEYLVRYGSSVLCSGSSTVLQYLANQNGITTRSVGLEGHVVMEAWYDNASHMYDPDFEVVPINEEGEVLSADALASSAQLTMDAYRGHTSSDHLLLDEVADIFTSKENNAYVPFEKTGKYIIVERVTAALKYALPVLFIFLGVFIGRRKGK